MSFLLNKMNAVSEAFRKAGSFNSDIGTFSGFTAIDVLSSNREKMPDLDLMVLNGGLFNNPYNEIGMSAVGKTTLWIQVISACMDTWNAWYGDVTECIFYNIENHTSPKRWMDITGYSEDLMRHRVRFVSKQMTIVEIYNELAALAKQKLAMQKELEVDTGIYSLDGGTIKVLPTTYVLIDSIAAMRAKTELEFTKDGDVKDTGTVAQTSNMDAMQLAKDNTMFINEAKKLCEDAKICIVMINHLVETPVLDRYNPPKPILPSLKYNQKLKGGNELIYQSFGVNMLSIRDRMFNEKNKVFGPGIHGLIANMEWLKNKNGPEGVKYPMVFDSDTGYKPELSDFELLYSVGQYGISGSPMGYWLDILPEIKFTRKNLLDLCHFQPILARALCFTTRLFLICTHVLRIKPYDLKELAEMDVVSRLDLILRYSMDYPGYIHHGWHITDESITEFKMMLANTYRKEMCNLGLGEEDFEFYAFTKGEYIMPDSHCSLNGETFSIGEFEYCIPDGFTKDDFKVK